MGIGMGCTGWAASRGIASRGCRGSDSPAAPIAALARNLASDAKPNNAPVAAVGRCSTASNPGSAAVAVDREAVASSTLEQSRDGGCNKAATAVATKPLQRLQQSRYGGCNSRYSGCNQAVTAVAKAAAAAAGHGRSSRPPECSRRRTETAGARGAQPNGITSL